MTGLAQSEAAGRYGAPPRLGRGAWTVILLAAPALILQFAPAASLGFQFDRSAIAGGELWRLITCHWTHWSTDHLMWDLGVFVLLVLLGAQAGTRRLLATLVLSSLLIPLIAWFALPEMVYYRGLSGLDSALFVFVAVTALQRTLAEKRRGLTIAVAIALAAFIAKVAFEFTTGATLFADSSNFVPVPLAHLVGGACGWIAGFRIWRM